MIIRAGGFLRGRNLLQVGCQRSPRTTQPQMSSICSLQNLNQNTRSGFQPHAAVKSQKGEFPPEFTAIKRTKSTTIS